jgi:hypothetical protein
MNSQFQATAMSLRMDVHSQAAAKDVFSKKYQEVPQRRKLVLWVQPDFRPGHWKLVWNS